MTKLDIKLSDSKHLQNIVGDHDRNLQAIRYHYHINIVVNPEEILIDSSDQTMKEKMESLFSCLLKISELKAELTERDTTYIIQALDDYSMEEIVEFYQKREEITKTALGRSVYPKTLSQKHYLKELNRNDIIIAYGVAGVGKTYIAVADAVRNLKMGRYQKIILSRPVVEAGESLGYLPGEIKEKVDPYLIPLYDSLYELLGKKTTDDDIEAGIIEIAPLAYMRGRTLENAYVILDEAQNTTKKQMKLFLTRLGFNTKMVITGDLTQIDLPKDKESGLFYAVRRLEGIDNLKIVSFGTKDVVRNPLVEKIIERLGDD